MRIIRRDMTYLAMSKNARSKVGAVPPKFYKIHLLSRWLFKWYSAK